MQRTLLIATLVSASLLAACGQRDDQNAGQNGTQRADNATPTRPNDAGGNTGSGSTVAGATTPPTTGQAQVQNDTSGGNALTDAAITTKINAALAADDSLKAMRIDVDTKDGQVTLTGTAPDTTAVARATVLAQNVNGVRGVANRLVVAKNG